MSAQQLVAAFILGESQPVTWEDVYDPANSKKELENALVNICVQFQVLPKNSLSDQGRRIVDKWEEFERLSRGHDVNKLTLAIVIGDACHDYGVIRVRSAGRLRKAEETREDLEQLLNLAGKLSDLSLEPRAQRTDGTKDQLKQVVNLMERLSIKPPARRALESSEEALDNSFKLIAHTPGLAKASTADEDAESASVAITFRDQYSRVLRIDHAGSISRSMRCLLEELHREVGEVEEKLIRSSDQANDAQNLKQPLPPSRWVAVPAKLFPLECEHHDQNLEGCRDGDSCTHSCCGALDEYRNGLDAQTAKVLRGLGRLVKVRQLARRIGGPVAERELGTLPNP